MTKNSQLNIQAFVDFQDLCIQAINSHGRPKIHIQKQNGSICYPISNPTLEYVELHSKLLSEALTPVSVEDLSNKFLDGCSNQKEKHL